MIELGTFALLMIMGFGFGQYNERRHYRSIIQREAALASLVAIASKYPPEGEVYRQQLVTGSVVIASDYFKSFLARLVNLFGGRVRAFEPLLDRGRREAILRVKEQAQKIDASMVFNIKYETSSIGGSVTTIEILAYGTALIPATAVRQ